MRLFVALPEPAQLLFAISYFDNDCSNGGISQALMNRTGDFLPLARKGYEAIGSTYSLQWLDFMCKPFGPQGPAPTQRERNRQMEAMTPDYWAQEDALREAWSKQAVPPPSSFNDWLSALYAVKHAAVLKPLVEQERKRAEER